MSSSKPDPNDNPKGQDQPGERHVVINEQTDLQPPSSEPDLPVSPSDTRDSNRALEASDHDADNPIMLWIRSKELGKTVLGFIGPLTSGLLLYQYKELTHLQANLIITALALGFAATLNGIALGGTYPRVASAIENIGMALVFNAFYGLVSSFLPPYLQWISWLCCAFSCLPLVLSHLPLKPKSPVQR